MPQPDRAIISEAREGSAINAERKPYHRPRMAGEGRYLVTCWQSPESNGVISLGHRHCSTIRRKGCILQTVKSVELGQSPYAISSELPDDDLTANFVCEGGE